MKCTKDQFLEKYGITNDKFKRAEISWDDLLKIEHNYIEAEPKLDEIRKDFLNDFIIDKNCGFHSFGSRLKNPEHLIAKIIRKRLENYSKYKDLTSDNYTFFVSDLIGFRGLILYREDWINFHQYILKYFKDDPNIYVTDNIVDEFTKLPDFYMAEPPKVHLRKGDYAKIYDNWVSPSNIKDGKHYRSIHYILKYKNHYIEVQVRTLFEEGWGEIDHEITYPYKMENAMLAEYSELLNRLSGMADEMSSFYRRMQNVDIQKFLPKDTMIKNKQDNIFSLGIVEPQKNLCLCKTPEEIIYNIINE